MKFTGWLFMLAGLLLVLDALYCGIMLGSMKKEMILLFIGVVVFYLGRMIEARAPQ
ncbi:MAG: hypothetical protein NOU37_00430 [Candidatus Brocadiales bacterium]|nr:hypothetical protein [Candidatus Bathyanammoxibius sp.]MCQ4573705.1 hypothetical protein [Candidatus Bathyanammoxibius amoris]